MISIDFRSKILGIFVLILYDIIIIIFLFLLLYYFLLFFAALVLFIIRFLFNKISIIIIVWYFFFFLTWLLSFRDFFPGFLNYLWIILFCFFSRSFNLLWYIFYFWRCQETLILGLHTILLVDAAAFKTGYCFLVLVDLWIVHC